MFEGRYCLVRGDRSGVYAGVLKARQDREAVLTDARKIWYWQGATCLAQLASEGTSKPNECKFPAPVADFYDWHHKLTGSCTQGRDAFARDHGLKMDDAMTPEEFIRLTCNAYGGDVIRQLAGRYGVTL